VSWSIFAPLKCVYLTTASRVATFRKYFFVAPLCGVALLLCLIAGCKKTEAPPAAKAHRAATKPSEATHSFPQANLKQGKLAILLDDLGSDRAAAEQIFALRYPLTISVLPEHAHSVEIAEEAGRRGYEVMLHLPMQAVGKEQAEPQQLRLGMPAGQVGTMVDRFLNEVPNVKGVNNHQGSQATADSELMAELMPVLHERKLFYVDSRTTAATVAFDTAQRDGVPAAFRNVPFLDDEENVAAIERQIALAMRGAKEKGEAIAIGHPHPATLTALREMLPKAERAGVRLVFVSELVH
jgi:uncharacterized protein